MKLQNRTLATQVQGEDVQHLQNALRQLGYNIPDEEINGKVFREATEQAVLLFQRQYLQQGQYTPGMVDERTAQLITAAMDALQPAPAHFLVRGQVAQQNGSFVKHVVVKAFNKDLRNEDLLGEATTDEKGSYEITYTASQLRRPEKKRANLLVRAFGQDGSQLAESEVFFNAQPVATIDLLVALPEGSQPSEYEHMLTALDLQGVQPADLTDEDITFLEKETGIERQSIEWLRQCDKLARETTLPAAVFYAFARQNLPLRLETLLSNTLDTLRTTIETALKQNIIPARLQDSLDEITKNLEQLSTQQAQQSTVRRIVGQVLDQTSGTPLAGFTVRAFDLRADKEPADLGYTITDSRGLFTLVSPAPNIVPATQGSQPPSEQKLSLHILDTHAKEVSQTEVQVQAGQEQALLRIAVPAAPATPTPTLTEVLHHAKLQPPQELLNHLERHGIQTLADVRMAGGIGSLDGLPATANDNTVRLLEAHANLNLLSPDISLNTMLIDKGFTSIRAIAETPLRQFMEATRGQIGDDEAARLHGQAFAQTRFLDNVLAGMRADAANGYASAAKFADLAKEVSPDGRDHKDCDSAVSPTAYLYDLLTYTVKHLRHFQNPITSQFLTDTFHQPFGDLVDSCSVGGRDVRQIRLCIEVLRSYLKTHALEQEQQEGLESAVKDYLFTAYTTLLNKLGTSYEEIRLARTDPAEKRQALADRLGIELGASRPDHLDTLFLHPSTITEQDLEVLFGLADTTRNPLSDGATLCDTTPAQITGWTLEGVRWNKNTDPEGNIYVSLKEFPRIELYKDTGRTNLVASGELDQGKHDKSPVTGRISLRSENDSGLEGSISIAYTSASTAIQLVALPRILSWQLQHLRTLWEGQDRSVDAYTDGLPLIDPDLLQLGDFRQPVAGQAPYELWQQRRKWVDDILANLEKHRKEHDLTYILTDVLVNPFPHEGPLLQSLAKLQQNLTAATDDTTVVKKAVEEITQTLHLTVGSFTRLMALKKKDDEHAVDPAQELTEAEWQEVYAILTQAQKDKQILSWRDEEREIDVGNHQKGIVLGPRDFWIALQEPSLSPWLATPQDRLAWQQALRTRSQAPIVDPDLIGQDDLNEAFPGNAAYDLWQSRSAWVQAQLDHLQASREREETPAERFDAILKSTLGISGADLVELAKTRETNKKFTARLDQLTLSRAAFLYLVRIQNLLTSGAPVVETEWSDVYAILVQVQKQRRFGEWREAEAIQGLLLGPDDFRAQSSPAQMNLPSWRATQEARNAWQDTLQARLAQEQAVFSGVQEAVGATETVTLPLLRDALLTFGVVGYDLEQKAQSITYLLLIDAKADGREMTTRTAQAITTLQSLLWSIRTGQLKENFLAAGSKPFHRTYLLPNGRTQSLLYLRQANNVLGLFSYTPGIDDTFKLEILLPGTWISDPVAVWLGHEHEDYWGFQRGVFARGSDNTLMHTWREGSTWHEWESLGGQLASDPAAISRQKTQRIDVFARGADDTLIHKWCEAGTWSEWESLGAPREGGLTSAPTVASWEGDRLDVFARGADDTLIHKWCEAGTWSEWESLGGHLASSPTAVPGGYFPRIDVYAQDLNGELIHTWNDSGGWQEWSSLWGFLTSAPSASSCGDVYGRVQVDVFAQGVDNTLVYWGPDAGEWESLALPSPFSLDAANFEEEWQWIGSYATWRAAMFVFLYPENILLPTLRRPDRETPAFGLLVSHLRGNRRLDPEQAREATRGYADYFRDICNLRVEATCIALTRTSAQQDRSFLYLFACSTVSNTVYWSANDVRDLRAFSQTFWAPVSELGKAEQILGAVPYLFNDRLHSILLFAIIREGDVKKLMMINYDLLNPGQRWSEPKALDLPKDISPRSDFSAVIEQSIVPGVVNANIRPHVVIHAFPQSVFYSRRINYDGTDWEADDFKSWAGPPQLISLLALVGSSYQSNLADALIFVQTQEGVAAGGFNHNGDGPRLWKKIKGKFVGVFRYNYSYPSASIYLYMEDASGVVNYGTTDQLFSPDGPVLDLAGPADLEHIAVHCGHLPFLNGELLAYHCKSGVGVRTCFTQKPSTFQLDESLRALIAPTSIGPYEITEQLSEDALLKRVDDIAQTYFALPPSNPQPPASPWSNREYLRVYLDEAYYFVPVYVALQLQQAGQYIAALDWFRTVYNYGAQGVYRPVWYGFTLEKALPFTYECAADWLLDPLNPHAIAQTRSGTYLRFTLLALVRCLLDFADAEFALDTAESLPRARRLYMTALDLLNQQELAQQPDPAKLISKVGADVPKPWEDEVNRLKGELATISHTSALKQVTNNIRALLQTKDSWEKRLERAVQLVRQAKASLPTMAPLTKGLEQRTRIQEQVDARLLALPAVAQATTHLGSAVGRIALQEAAPISVSPPDSFHDAGLLPTAPIINLPAPDTRGAAGPQALLAAPPQAPHSLPPPFAFPLLEGVRGSRPVRGERKLAYQAKYVSKLAQQYWVPPNPLVQTIREHTELQLFKLQTGRNIEGQQREVSPYAAPTDTQSGLPTIGPGGQLILPGTATHRPTPYRYNVLIERAKQLVNHAQQLEATFLSLLEKRDEKEYTLLKARQDASLARAGIQLQDLKVTAAEDGVTLADLQQQRAQIQVDHYQELLDEGISGLEEESLALLRKVSGMQAVAASHSFLASSLPASISISMGFPPSASVSISPQGAESAVASAISSMAAAESTIASVLSTMASYERRAQEWMFQQTLAQQDVRIGVQQVRIAQDQVRVAGQERTISVLQADHADAVVDYLANKQFTSFGLYDWMSSVLEGVYRYFLQQATTAAQLAADQLGFERQEVPPPFIQRDYWVEPTQGETGSSPNEKAPDRRGLTGSARLLQDIYQLDQYAFDTNKRKLQLTHTLSLSRLAPVEFQRFCQSGVIRFATPMELFDRAFPGHYLRLIHKVRASVIALIPAVDSIRATLSTTGASRVVIGGDVFQTITVRRDPETVALTSPRDATGLFQLDAQPPSDMLLPFEGMGVETMWEFRMPKAANLFDYRTIADVLLTIEYTALSSADYRQQVIERLNPSISADRPFSFRNELADQWYDLHHPEQRATPDNKQLVVSFTTQRDHFPPNIEDLRIQQIVLYFAPASGQTVEGHVNHLHFTEQGSATPLGGEAQSVDGIVSTRKGNAGSWTPLLGKTPFGTWELALPTEDITNLLKDEQIDDILFVITYSGRTPEWPV